MNAVYDALKHEFAENKVRRDEYTQKGNSSDFPVLREDGQIVSAFSLSPVLQHLPPVTEGYIFVERSVFNLAKTWLKANKRKILALS